MLQINFNMETQFIPIYETALMVFHDFCVRGKFKESIEVLSQILEYMEESTGNNGYSGDR